MYAQIVLTIHIQMKMNSVPIPNVSRVQRENTQLQSVLNMKRIACRVLHCMTSTQTFRCHRIMLSFQENHVFENPGVVPMSFEQVLQMTFPAHLVRKMPAVLT